MIRFKKYIPNLVMISSLTDITVFLYLGNKRILNIECSIIYDKLRIDKIHKYPRKKYYNKGYGTFTISRLIEMVKNDKDYDYLVEVFGYFSISEIENKEKLIHFYEKLGFKITIFDKVSEGHFGMFNKQIERG